MVPVTLTAFLSGAARIVDSESALDNLDEPRPLISEGALVEVTSGPYAGKLGEVSTVLGGVAWVLIPRLNFSVAVFVDQLKVRFGP